MKKKTVVTLMAAFILAVSLSACGSKPASGNDSDAARIAELEKELEELRAELNEVSNETVEDVPVEESWTDDTIIAFTDETMLKKIREITGVNERDITYGDVKNITEFSGSYLDIAPLKYFTGLVNLDVSTENDTNLDSLKTLTNLVTLNIAGESITDLRGISNLPKLESLRITNYNSLTDLSTLGNIESLKNFEINGALENLDGISGCINIEDLSIYGEFSDINALSNLTKLSELVVSSNNITDISPLSNLTNLTRLVVFSDSMTDISPIANLTNLTDLRIGSDSVVDISSISSLMNLTDLYIRFDNMTDISPVSSLVNLEHLGIYGGNFAKLEIGGCINLNYLSIQKNNVLTDINSISNLENLKSLYLGRSNSGGNLIDSEWRLSNLEDINPIGNLTNLRSLFLNCSLSTTSDISALLNLPNLEYSAVTIGVIDSDKVIENKGDLEKWLRGEFFN